MDVDSMTTNERAELMRKEACFKCKKTRHQKDQQKAMMDKMEKNPLDMDFA